MRMEATPLGAEPVGLSLQRGAVSAHAHYSDHTSIEEIATSLPPTHPDATSESGEHIIL